MAETGFTDDFKRNFLAGIAALFPIVVTLVLLTWLYARADDTVGRAANAACRAVLARSSAVFRAVFPGAPAGAAETVASRSAYAAEHFPRVVGLLVALVVLAVAVYLLGKFLRGYVGRRAMEAVHRLFERFPLVKAVYPYARQVGEYVFTDSGRRRFSQVVVVQYPRRGIYTVGFLTGDGLEEVEDRAGRDLVTVFVPTSPTPFTGFTIQVPPEEVIKLEMTADEALRYCITAGVLAAAKVREQEEGAGPRAQAEVEP